MGNDIKQKNSRPWVLIIILVVLTISTAVVGYFYYESQVARTRESFNKELTTVAESKVTQIENWRSERLGDALNIQKDPLIVKSVKAFLASPFDLNLRNQNLGWMNAYIQAYSYSSIYIVSDNQVKLKTGLIEIGLESENLKDIQAQNTSHQVVLSDLHLDQIGNVRMDLLVPLIDIENGQDVVFATVVLRIDPKVYLFPLIQSWPSSSQTAETLLVEKEGDNVLYLNELRYQSGTALKFRFPLTNDTLPASMAVRGITGIVDGNDYRGVPVIADLVPVAGTDWKMVAKVDRSEVYGPLQAQGWRIVFTMFLILSVIGLSLGTMWRRQTRDYYKSLYESESIKNDLSQQFGFVLENSDEAVLLISETGEVISANTPALELYGYSGEEFAKLNIRDLYPPADADKLQYFLERIKKLGGLHHDADQVKKDGSPFIAEISSRYFTQGEKGFYQKVILDVTERKRSEEALRENEEKYRGLVENMPDALFVNLDNKLVMANQAFIDLMGAKSQFDVLGKSPFDIFHPDFHEVVRERIKDLQVGGKPVPAIEEKIIRLDGRVVDVEVNAAPFYYGGKRAIHVVLRDITDRKKSEKERSRLSEVLSRSLNEIYIFDPVTLLFLYENPAALNKLGYSADEMSCMTPLNIKPEFTMESFRKKLDSIMVSENKLGVFETLHRRKDGTEYPIEVHLQLIETGNEPVFLAMIDDITLRKATEDQIRISEAKYRSLVENASDGIFVSNEKGMIVEVNEAGCRILGYSREELLRLSLRNVILTEEIKTGPLNIEDLEKGNATLTERTMVRKDGLSVPVEISARRLPDGRLQGIVRDITDRIQAQEALRNNEEKYRNLFENITQGFALHEIILDDYRNPIDYRFIDVNPAYQQLTGLSSEKILGKRVKKVSPGLEQFWIDTYGKVALTGKPIRFERYSEEIKKYFDISAFSPRFGQFAVIISDITERKRIEEEIKQLNAELEMRVRDRTEELEAFTYSVSHDLRAPLRAISGYTNILEDDYKQLFTGEALRYLGLVQSNTRMMGQLVDDLLMFAHLGRRSVTKNPVNMREIVKNVLAQMEDSIKNRDIGWTVKKLPDATGDATMITQVVQNLVSNAVKFTSKVDHAKIEIGSIQSDPPGVAGKPQTVYYVKDNGVGFDMRYYDKLFGVFQRLHSVEEFEGTGVGLAIVKRIVEKHGGQVWAESELNIGTTFYFTIEGAQNE